jgi:hypothetical protein
MPLTKTGKKIKKAMHKTYGKKKGEKIFFASQNKGTIKGTHESLMAKRWSRQSLLKAGGSSRGMDGAGSRGTGRPKLMPRNHTESESKRGSLAGMKGSSKGMKGNQGPVKTHTPPTTVRGVGGRNMQGSGMKGNKGPKRT